VLNGKAITKQPHPMFAQISWQSNWDPTTEAGEIFAFDPYYTAYRATLKVYKKDGQTIIEKRISDNSYGRYKRIADDLFFNTDYSGCDDLE